MIIYGPSNAPYDIDLGPVFLSDYYHNEYFNIVESVVKSGGNPAPASDNNLINGKMDFDCSTKAAGDTTTCTNNAGFSKFKFTTGKTHRLRLINAGAEGIQRFSIDGHTLTVIANDFVPLVSSFLYPTRFIIVTPPETLHNYSSHTRDWSTH
jgi:FtsP/CotA-like multicopper oxidase with cupredoxin domain